VILALPWVLLTLAAMPALAAIYLLRNRSRRQPVSSLMLWMDLTRPREGGRRLKRMQVPLLLLLELLALGFLGLASAGPYVRAAGASRPLVIVLDDSFSMRAGGEDSSRARAVRAVEETLRAEPDASVQFILAGSAPQMLGDRAADLRRAGELLARWRCLAPAASLDAAVSLAATVGGRTARILVCTDRPPPREISEGRVLWRAFGRQSPNVAIVNAARSVHEGRDRCLVELANYSDDRARAVLTLSADAVPAALATRAVDLPAGEKATLFFEVPADTKIVYARLGNDALGLDNKVTLLPDAGRPVRVALRLENPALREAVQRALEASGRARLTAAGAELLVTDGAPPPDRAPETWSLRFIVDKEAEAFVGPFVLDGSHPLCEGLDLSGVVWAAAKTPPLAGPAVISAGNVSLVTDAARGERARDLRIRLQPELSTLLESTNWPVFIWNLLAYRAQSLPGPQASNVRLGSDVKVTVSPEVESARIRCPDGEAYDRPVHDFSIQVDAEQCGVYEVSAGEARYAFAVNALHPGESDLRACAAGEWGQWPKTPDPQAGYMPIASLVLIAALGAMTVHLTLAGQARKEAQP